MLEYVDMDFFCQCDYIVAKNKSEKKKVLSKFECAVFYLKVEAESLTSPKRIWSQSPRVQISTLISGCLSELCAS